MYFNMYLQVDQELSESLYMHLTIFGLSFEFYLITATFQLQK